MNDNPLKYEYSVSPAGSGSPTSSLSDTSDSDPVNHPSHYSAYKKDGVECIDAMRSAFGDEAVSNFCICNSFKYIWRHSSKNGMEDIEKAIWYLNKYKELNIIVEGR